MDVTAAELVHYRLLLEAIADHGLYRLSPDGRVAAWSAGAEALLGYSEADILGQPVSRLHPPDHAGLLDRAARDGRAAAETWLSRRDGSQVRAHVRLDALRAPAGDLLGFAATLRDLTERKLRQDALARTEEQFRRLVQGVTDYALYMIDPDGTVASWNAGAERIKGYREDEILGEHFSRFYTPEERAAGEPERALAIARAEGRFEKEAWRQRKDGSRFFAHIVIDPIRDTDGTLLGFAKITRDISQRLEAQRQLDAAREQLFQAQKLEAVGKLTGGIAHDFNNLLTAVLGSLELLRKRLPPDPGLTRLLDNARMGAERGASLTQRMLAFARRQELTLKPIALPALIDGMADLLARSLGSGIALETRFADSVPPALSDANQVESAVLNLALNARDAMPEGGRIVISATERPFAEAGLPLPPGRYVCLTVADSGQGMDAETLAKATEPFFTTKGVGKGTGLGLSMVHGLAEQSGGGLVLRSVPGDGTLAELWLPVAGIDCPEAPAPAADPAGKSAPRPLRILAVDDDVLVLMNTTAMLEDLGHVAVEAFSGSQALDLAAKQEFDAVITDQSMPGMTGSQLAAALRARHPDLPVILATGYAELPPGGDNALPRLSKPFSQGDLRKALLPLSNR